MVTPNLSKTADQRQAGHIAVLLAVLLFLVQMLMLAQESILELCGRSCDHVNK